MSKSGLESTKLRLDNDDVTKEDLIKKLKGLSKGEFAKVAPLIEADLDAADDLTNLHREIRAGRRSARTQPILEARDVYSRVRRTCSRGS